MLITLASDAGGDQQWIPGRVLPASAHYKAIALQYCITIGQWCFCIVLVSTCKMGTETPVILLLYLSHLLRTQHTPPGGLTVICRLCNCINCTNVTQIILAYFRTTAIRKLHFTALLSAIRSWDIDTCRKLGHCSNYLCNASRLPGHGWNWTINIILISDAVRKLASLPVLVHSGCWLL